MTFSQSVGPIIVALTMTWLLLAAWYDVRWRRIPNGILALAAPFAIVGTLYYDGWPYGVLSFALGGLAYFGCMFALALLFRNGIGGGDIKMGAVIGLALGWPGAMIAFAASWIAAGLVGVAMPKKSLPMAPLLLGGAVFALALVRM